MSPDARPRVVILGTGWGARVQVPAFRGAGFEVAGIWSRQASRAEAVATELGIPVWSTDVEALVTEAGVDLVSVVSPPHEHRRMVLAALAAGRHVLCEKPFALNIAEALEMLEAAAGRHDLLALVDHELRFLNSRLAARRLLAEGWAGELVSVRAVFRADWRLGDRPWSWWSSTELGGGTLGAIGSHLVDALQWIVDRPVAAVAAALQRTRPIRPDETGLDRVVTADDEALLLLRWEGDLAGSVEASAGLAGPSAHRLAIAGTDGTMWLDGDHLRAFRPGASEPEIEVLPTASSLPAGLEESEWGRGTWELARVLERAIVSGDRKGIRPAATFRDGVLVQAVLDAARRSAATGQWEPTTFS